MKTFKTDEFGECPVCRHNTFKYDAEINASRCYDEFCRWTDRVAPVIDVPMYFLEDCFNKAEPGPQKNKLKEIIELTKKVKEEYKFA